jgi:hypothetical protein
MHNLSRFSAPVTRAGMLWLSLPLIAFVALTFVRLLGGNDVFSGTLTETLQRLYNNQDHIVHDLLAPPDGTPHVWSRWLVVILTMKWVMMSYAFVALVFLVAEVLLRLITQRAPRDDSYTRVRPFRVLVLSLIGAMLAMPVLLWNNDSGCFIDQSINFACGGSLSLLLASLTFASWIIFIVRAVVLHQIDQTQISR